MNWSLATIVYYLHCSSQSWALYKFIVFKFKKYLLLLSPSWALLRMNYQVKDFSYLTNNIPLASRSKYLQILIEKTESLIHRMHWKAFFFSKNHDTINNEKETYGFKSKCPPPHIRTLNEFEDSMLNMIQWVEFKTNCTATNSFQAKLDKDVQEIWQDKNISVKANKTTNHYKAEPQDYLNLLQKNGTKAYKKTSKSIPDSITSIDKEIAQDLKLDNRIEVSVSRAAFITLKDYKPDFTNNPTSRLINPTKSEIGIISKHILDNINKEIIKVTKANLWRCTSNVIEWFQPIPNKSQHAFITFDVCDFYPSISKQLLTKAFDYASQFTHITPQDRHIITREKITVVSPEHAMGKEEHQQLVWRDNGLIWWSRDMWTRWHLHVVPHHTKI